MRSRPRGNGILTLPLGLEAVHVNFSRTCLGVHLDVGRRGRPRRRPLLIALAARVIDAKIVLRVLIEILGGNSIVIRCRFARQGEVALEYLVGAAADLDVGPVAVECLIVCGFRGRWLNGRSALKRPRGR